MFGSGTALCWSLQLVMHLMLKSKCAISVKHMLCMIDISKLTVATGHSLNALVALLTAQPAPFLHQHRTCASSAQTHITIPLHTCLCTHLFTLGSKDFNKHGCEAPHGYDIFTATA